MGERVIELEQSWFDHYEGPKALYLQCEPKVWICTIGWNRSLIGFGTSGHQIEGRGETTEAAIRDARLAYEAHPLKPRPV